MTDLEHITESNLVVATRSSEFRHQLGRFLYVPTMVGLLCVMAGTVLSGFILIIYNVENANLPVWFNHVIRSFIVPVGSFYNIYDTESSKHLNIVFLMLIGIVTAIFVKRCSGKENKFELFVVISLIVLAGLMLYVKGQLSAEHLQNVIKNADEVFHHMEIMVIRNCNLAAAIVATALGTTTNR